MFDSLFSFIWVALYEMCSLLCWMMQCIYETFELFAGTRAVEYQGEETFIINIFFNNPAISRLYWGMATIGVVLCFAFCIIAVIRKMFDAEDKMQATLGAIVGSMIKSILMILMMNFFMMVILNSANILLQQVDYVFGSGKNVMGNYGKTITFSEKDYATMGRIYHTIGNYAINSSHDSRVNINSCFNEIREDMLILEKKEVFDYDYDVTDSGELPESWQSVLVPIARARNLKEDIPIDEYDAELVEALLYAMDILKSNRSFTPLSSYKVPGNANGNGETRLDTLVMMTGTMNAAKNPKYNENPSIFDALRGAYVAGDKDVHTYNTIKKDFDISEFDFLMIIIVAVFLGYQMIFVAINAVARIFNMILLYLAAPPIIATTPLDGGGKMKQWTTAFVIQSLSVVGALMAMRLITFFVPIIYDSSLNFFPGSSNGTRDYLIRLFFVMAVAFTANKSIGMLSGILADSAGWQSVNAGNVGDGVINELKSGYGNLKGAAGLIFGKGKDKGNGKSSEDSKDSKDGKDQDPENKGGFGEKEEEVNNSKQVDDDSDNKSLLGDQEEDNLDQQNESLLGGQEEDNLDQQNESLLGDQEEDNLDQQNEGLLGDQEEDNLDQQNEGLLGDQEEDNLGQQNEGLLGDQEENNLDQQNEGNDRKKDNGIATGENQQRESNGGTRVSQGGQTGIQQEGQNFGNTDNKGGQGVGQSVGSKKPPVGSRNPGESSTKVSGTTGNGGGQQGEMTQGNLQNNQQINERNMEPIPGIQMPDIEEEKQPVKKPPELPEHRN